MTSNSAYIDGIAQVQSNTVEWSDDQKNAIDFVFGFMADQSSKSAVIGGIAGSGKSTIIPYLVERFGGPSHDKVQVCAPTGKAALVLKRKGITTACTLHSFLYRYYIEKNKCGEIVYRRQERPAYEFSHLELVIVDEASMLSRDIYDFLMRLPFKVLYIGDHFQLPPVNDDLNIMKEPGFKMEKILRQLEGNPIIKLAEMARNGEKIPLGVYGDSRKTKAVNHGDFIKYDEILVWTNEMKDRVNEEVRRLLGYPVGIPQCGDKMIVKKNHKDKNLYNGQIVYMMSEPSKTKQGWWNVELMDEVAYMDAFVLANTDSCTTGIASIHLSRKEFDNLFTSCKRRSRNSKVKLPDINLDWGYAITVHSAQGSSWGNVAIMDDPRMNYVMDEETVARWRYTAITRAEESVTIYCL